MATGFSRARRAGRRAEVTLTGVDKAEALEYEFPVSDLD
jgi:hypothetical protein